MKRLLKWTGAVLLASIIVVIIVGGGFGKKTHTCQLDDIALMHFEHRAGARAFPENSYEGVLHSRALGYPGVELDIRRTGDGVFVLMHDADGERLLGVHGTIADGTLAEWRTSHLLFNGAPTNARIATLENVFNRNADSLLYYLDTKITGLGEAEELAQLVIHHRLERCALIASSSIPFLTTLEYRHPELNTVLEGFDKGEEWTYALFPKNFRPDYLSSFAFETDSAQVGWLRAHDLLPEKIVYGLDSDSYTRMRALGITRFIADEGVPAIGR